jgi:pimeloyl-ACP methyl ester carboxylesterase
MGRSLGSGVAVHVASLRGVGGVILITPFDSLVNVAKIHYPFLPVKYLMRHRFDSVGLAPKIRIPLLAVVAGQDDIIPNQSSQKLVAKWGGEKSSVVIPDAGHNDIHQYRDYWQAIESFITSMRLNKG